MKISNIVRMTKSNIQHINKADIPHMFLNEVKLGTKDIVLGNDGIIDLLIEIKKVNTEIYKICKYILKNNKI